MTAFKVPSVCLDLQVPKDPLERTVTRVKSVDQARREAKETRVNRDLLDPADPRV